MSNNLQSERMKSLWLNNRDDMISICQKGGKANKGIKKSSTEGMKSHPNYYSKEYLGEEKYNKIEKNRKAKISKTTSLRQTGKPSHALGKHWKWKEDALDRKSMKGHKAWNAGLTKHVDIRVKKYGISQRKDPNILQHGIDFSVYGWTKQLAQEVRKRDYFTCQVCGKERVTIVHHINGDRKVNEMDNLITLCRRCHQLAHMERQENGQFKLRKIPARISDLKT